MRPSRLAGAPEGARGAEGAEEDADAVEHTVAVPFADADPKLGDTDVWIDGDPEPEGEGDAEAVALPDALADTESVPRALTVTERVVEPDTVAVCGTEPDAEKEIDTVSEPLVVPVGETCAVALDFPDGGSEPVGDGDGEAVRSGDAQVVAERVMVTLTVCESEFVTDGVTVSVGDPLCVGVIDGEMDALPEPE
jgi:hypothetical protein